MHIELSQIMCSKDPNIVGTKWFDGFSDHFKMTANQSQNPYFEIQVKSWAKFVEYIAGLRHSKKARLDFSKYCKVLKL